MRHIQKMLYMKLIQVKSLKQGRLLWACCRGEFSFKYFQAKHPLPPMPLSSSHRPGSVDSHMKRRSDFQHMMNKSDQVSLNLTSLFCLLWFCFFKTSVPPHCVLFTFRALIVHLDVNNNFVVIINKLVHLCCFWCNLSLTQIGFFLIYWTNNKKNDCIWYFSASVTFYIYISLFSSKN